MARKAIVHDATGIVLNVIEIEDGADWSPPDGHSLLDAGVNAEAGGSWDGDAFSKKPVFPPDPKVARRDALGQKLLGGTATLTEVREYLTLRDGIVVRRS